MEKYFVKSVLFIYILPNLLISVASLENSLDETKSIVKDESREQATLSRQGRSIMNSGWRRSKQEIKEKFERYYECKQKSSLDTGRLSDTITAILALEGQRIDLNCPICIRPDQTPKAHWQRVRTADTSIEHIRSGTPGMKIKRDLTLVIKRVDIVHAGQYFCIQNGDAIVIYQVDVLFREPQRTVYENNTQTLLRSQRLVDHNLEVFTEWSDWGSCDQCGKPGRRMRFGTCMVQKINKRQASSPIDIPIMELYPNGVPCRSTVLVRDLSNLKGIGDRKSEVIVGSCLEPCPTSPPPIKVTDSSGHVIQIIEAGYHPMDKKPEIPPMVIRSVRHEKEAGHLILSCPTSEKSKVRWQRGERAINPATIRHQTRGRVFVDRLNRLHIRKLRRHDSAPYNCWIWQRHVATIKILVFQPFNENIRHYITYGGLCMTIIAFPIFCFCKLFCRKRQRPTKSK